MNLVDAQQYLDSRGLKPAPHNWYLASRVHQPGSVVLKRWSAERSMRPTRPLAGAMPSGLRSYTAAENNGWTWGWSGSEVHVNASLMRNLRTLRARSNDLAKNNDHARNFLRSVKSNVVGPVGVVVQVRVLRNSGQLNEAESSKAEAAFKAWGQPQHCDFHGSLSWIEMQRLWIETIARDGEVLVRRWKGPGAHGYQLQLLSPTLLDETYNVDLANGNRIRMGIEFDAAWRRVAYHLQKDQPADPMRMSATSRDFVRVPASEIWHDFVSEWIGQMRGAPWMCSSLIRQKRLNEFETATVAAAEEGAKKLAWIETPEDNLQSMADQAVSDGKAPEGSANAAPFSGTLYTDSGAGIHYARLPVGAKVNYTDGKYPDAAVGDFVKTHLRGIAAGLGVPYHELAGDLESVNYSSARVGEIAVREVWKALQTWMIERLHARVYSEWLPLAQLTGALPVQAAQLARYDVATWQPRRWSWVDPLKDLTAAVLGIDNGLTSRQRVIREAGNDPDEIWKELEEEKARLAGLLPSKTPAAPSAAAPTDPAGEPADPTDPGADPADPTDPQEPT